MFLLEHMVWTWICSMSRLVCLPKDHCCPYLYVIVMSVTGFLSIHWRNIRFPSEQSVMRNSTQKGMIALYWRIPDYQARLVQSQPFSSIDPSPADSKPVSAELEWSLLLLAHRFVFVKSMPPYMSTPRQQPVRPFQRPSYCQISQDGLVKMLSYPSQSQFSVYQSGRLVQDDADNPLDSAAKSDRFGWRAGTSIRNE